MLTPAQRARCAQIAAQLDGGDGRAIAKAEAIAPLSPAERGLIWDLRQHVIAQAERLRQREAAMAAVTPRQSFIAARPARPETNLQADVWDLDFWASDDDGIPNEDEPGQLWKLCPACKGAGFSTTGARCTRCSGAGRIEVEDVDDGEDDGYDEDDEKPQR